MDASDRLHQDLCNAYGRLLEKRRRRRRTERTVGFLGLGSLFLAAAAFGAAALLGWPAPWHVQQEIAAVDRGLPADLRLNPDVEHARAVASTGDSTLYAATLRDGGYCTELVTAGDRGRGATCTTSSQSSGQPIQVALPADENAGPASAVALAGRVNASGATALEVRYADGQQDPISFGEDRFFVLDVPTDKLASVHAGGLELIAIDDKGSIVGRETVPADWDDPAVPDEAAPLFVSTRSDESDFTKVYGLEGHVSAAGAALLVLEYANGEHVDIAVQPDGSFEYAVPQDRVGDFMKPRLIVARDTDGNVIASRPIAAVAYWRGVERGRR